MTRAKVRAFKCRMGVHRLRTRGAADFCKDCHSLVRFNGERVRPGNVAAFKFDKDAFRIVQLPDRVLVMRPSFAIRVHA